MPYLMLSLFKMKTYIPPIPAFFCPKNDKIKDIIDLYNMIIKQFKLV